MKLRMSVILLVCLLVPSGCTWPESLDSSEIGEASAKPVVLKFWGGVPEDAGPGAVVEQWNREHPDIQVEYVRFSNDDKGNLRLDTALLNGQQVDLYVNYFLSRLKQRVNTNAALNLSSLTDYDFEENIGAKAEKWKIDGKYYAMPTKRNYYFILLNKKALDEAGLPVPLDWTWEDLRYYARKLTTEDRWGYLQYDFVVPYPIDGTLSHDQYVKADGTSYFDHPYVAAYLQILHDMMHRDRSTPTLEEQLTVKMPVELKFLKGEAAMLFAGEWLLRYANNMERYPRDFEIAFAPIPKIVENQENFRYMGGVGDAVSINPNSEYKEEAWQFLKWYAEEGMVPMAAGGRLPASRKADMEEALRLLLHNQEAVYHRPSLYRMIRSDRPTMQLSLAQPVIDLRREEYEKYFLNQITLEETIRNMVRRHNEYMELD